MIIDRIVQWFLPREARFFVYLESMAKNMAHAADVFAELREADGRSGQEDIAKRLEVLEHENDEVAHTLYEELDRSFVTPIDREDLHMLTARLDDVIDIFEACASRILIFRLERLTDPMKELVRLLREAVHEIAGCVPLLQDVGSVDRLQVRVIHVNSLENEGDVVYRKALSELFENASDPIELIREKEILDQLERGLDTCEDIVDLIRSVVVKNA